MRSEKKTVRFGVISIPVLQGTVVFLSLAKTFYNRIVEPSSFFFSTFCLTYLHVAYNKQKMDLLYPKKKKELKIFTPMGYFKIKLSPNNIF